jgi:hypothetical protein
VVRVKLRSQRVAAGLSLRAAARKLEVEPRVLNALERDKWTRIKIDDAPGLAARAAALYAGRDLAPLGRCVDCAFRPESAESQLYSGPASTEGMPMADHIAITQRAFHCHRWMPRTDDGGRWEGEYDPAIKPGGAPRVAPMCVGFIEAKATLLCD